MIMHVGCFMEGFNSYRGQDSPRKFLERYSYLCFNSLQVHGVTRLFLYIIIITELRYCQVRIYMLIKHT